MPTHVQAPDGSVIEFPDSMKDADIEAAMGKLFPSKPEQSFGAALKEYGHKMNPVAMAQGIAENVMHPGEAIKRWGQVNNKILSNAEDAYKRGDYTEAAAHTLYYVLNGVPGLGEALDEAGTKLRNGDVAGGLADTAALGTQVAAGIKAPAIAEAAPTVAKGTVGAVKGGVQGGLEPVKYGHLRLPLPASAAGAAAGHYVGNLVGMPEAGMAAGAAYPVIRGAIKGYKAAVAEAPKAAPSAASSAASAAAAPAAEEATPKAPGQAMAEADGQTWSKLSQDDKLNYAHLEGAQESGAARSPAPPPYVPRTPADYGVKPAEVPPQPAPSASAPTPASAAPPSVPISPQVSPSLPLTEVNTPKVQPIRPETPPVPTTPPTSEPTSAPTTPKPASGATAAKSARYADAISKWAKDMGMTPKDIADQWGTTTPEVRGQIMLELKRKGYLGANETIPKTSAPGIIDALKAKAATIKPPAGFGMGSMGTRPPAAAPSAIATAESMPVEASAPASQAASRTVHQFGPQAARLLVNDKPVATIGINTNRDPFFAGPKDFVGHIIPSGEHLYFRTWGEAQDWLKAYQPQ